MIKQSAELDRYLTMTVDKGGSDLHLQTGAKPAIRILGDVVFLATKTPGSTVEQLTGLLAAENSRQGYTVQDDGSIAIPAALRPYLGGQDRLQPAG